MVKMPGSATEATGPPIDPSFRGQDETHWADWGRKEAGLQHSCLIFAHLSAPQLGHLYLRAEKPRLFTPEQGC